MKKQIATNTFSEGMTLDLNPLVTPSNVITNCLNGTLVTMNGNELMLLNDMGNGRVETATLPEGYVPIGTCSHGGFIYIVSYNPLKDLAQIGSFPSPERNIDTTELSDLSLKLTDDEFYLTGDITINNDIKFKPLKPIIRKVFDLKVLNPGDKYIVFASNLYTNNLSDVDSPSHTLDSIPRDWKIRIASIEDSGKITEFDNIKWYKQNVKEDEVAKLVDYYIKEYNSTDTKLKGEIVDLDDYRTLVNSAYSIFESKRSGKLCLLISPEMIDGFNCSYSLYLSDNSEIKAGTPAVTPYIEIDPDKEEVILPGDGTLEPKPDDGTNPDNPETNPDKDTPEPNPDENNPETKPDGGTNPDKVIQLWINSSWTNSGRDINPEGILVKIKNNIVDPELLVNLTAQYSFTNSRNLNNETNYINSETRFRNAYSSEDNTFIDAVLNKDYSEYRDKRIIHRIYENNVPTENYYLGLKPGESSGEEYTIESDFLNNYFNLDVPKKVLDIKINDINSATTEEERANIYNSNVYTVEVYPYMRTGYLPLFKREFTINLNEIGKSETKLTQWKYYVREEDMYLDWALTTNLPLNKTISKVWLEFYDNQGLCATLILDGLSSYNGNFLTSINFGRPSSYFGITGKREDGTIIKHRGFEVSYSKKLDSSIKDETVFPVEVSADGTIERIIPFDEWKKLSEDKQAGYKYYQNDSGILYKGIPYLVLIKYKTSKLSTFNNDESEPIELDYRWLWTAPVFNSFYDIKEDFKDLQPTLELNLDVQYSTNSKYRELSKLYTNSKNVSFEKERDLTRLSANVLYVEDTSGGLGNVDANVTLLLNDDFGTFRIDNKDGIKKFKLRTYLKRSKCEAPVQPSIIKEELNSGNTELLETSNVNENITLTKTLQTLLLSKKQVTDSKKELWETSDKSFNNLYQFILPNLNKDTENDSREYLPSIEAKDDASEEEKSNDLKGSTYSENLFNDTGKVKVPISCEIINYSKFFTTCDTAIVKMFTVLRRAIEKISDLSKYNLTRDADGNVAFKTALNLYTYYKDDGSDRAETRVVRCSYSKFTGNIYKDILEYNELDNKYGGFSDSYNDTADGKSQFKAYYDTNSCVLITLTEANGVGKKGDNYWPLETVLANSSKNISTINTEASFIFPVLTVSDQNTQNENTNSWVQRTKVAAYYDNEGKDSARYFQFLADNLIDFQWDQTNKYRCYFGGNLGLSVEDNIIIDFNHPITAWEKGWNNYDDTSSEAWFPNNITIGEDALHFYAPAVLGLLYSLIYRLALTELRRIYSYDNYTYYEPFTTSYKQDMVYRVFSTKQNNANDDVLILGKFNLATYVNTILNTVSSNLENLENHNAALDQNVTLTFKECIKTVPLLFNINYKQPLLIRNSFEGYGLFDSKLIELPDMSDLYVENFRTNELESLTEVSEFLPARIKNSSIERLKEYSKYSEVVIKPEGELPVNYYNSRGYIFNIPVLYNYLKVENNTIKIKKEISSQVSKMSNNKNIRAHSDRWIYNLTKIDIFTGVDLKHELGGNYRVVNIYNKSLE